MSEHDIQVILVWGLVLHVVVEGVVHAATWYVLRGQIPHETPIGPALQSREGWKAARYVAFLFFHVLLAWIVTFDSHIAPTSLRVVVYLATLVVAMTASWKGVGLIRAIQKEYRGV